MRSLRRSRRVANNPPAALAEADELARAGRYLDAIAVLAAANRGERDGALEQRLVRLRNEAFAELDAAGGPASWPPEAGDLFPDPGIPEIAPAELSAAAMRSGIIGHGALAIRGLIPPDRVERLIYDIDHAFAAHDAYPEGGNPDEAAWYTPFTAKVGPPLGPVRPWVRGGGGVLAVDSPRAAFDVLETFDAVGLGSALTEYLGERPVLAAKKWTLRRVPVGSGTNWHQDGAFLGDGVRAVNVWIALTHCGDNAPGLDVVARRLDQIAPTGTEGAIFDWSVGEPVVELVAQGRIERPIFEAGDALLFDDMFLHRTAVGPDMTRERYAIESWFFAPSQYPVDQIPVTF